MKPLSIARTGLAKCFIVFVSIVVLGFLLFPFYKHTFPGILIRSVFRGVPPARLLADDLADDIRTKEQLAPLQDWSVRTLQRYRAGQVITTGKSAFSGPFSVRLATQEIPDWLLKTWGGDRPEVAILLNSSNNQPECVAVSWYLSGILVGPTNYVTTYRPWYIVQVKPGTYAYSIER